MALQPSDARYLTEALRLADRSDTEALHFLSAVGGITEPVSLGAVLLRGAFAGNRLTGEEIGARWGNKVWELLDKITDPAGLSPSDRRERQLAMARNPCAAVREIRLVDLVMSIKPMPTSSTPVELQAYDRWLRDMIDAFRGTSPPLEKLLVERSRATANLPPRASATGGSRLVPCDDAATQAVMRKLGAIEAAAKALTTSLALLIQELREMGVLPHDHRRPKRGERWLEGRKKLRFNDRVYVEWAVPGVGSITFHQLPDGRPAASFDGAAPFPLIPSTAAILLVLVTMPGRDADGWPPAAKCEVILKALADRGVTMTKRAFIVALNRLREHLLKGSQSPALVQTTSLGIRIRLRPPASETA